LEHPFYELWHGSRAHPATLVLFVPARSAARIPPNNLAITTQTDGRESSDPHLALQIKVARH
jgi:hypothetical protein